MSTGIAGKHTKVFRFVVAAVLIFCSFCAVMPFVLLISSSLSSESALYRQGYGFIPRGFSTYAYEFLFKSNLASILRALGLSVLVTAVGTGLHLLVAPMFAYPLSRRDYPHARVVTVIVLITMMLNGGMVGQYLLWANLFHIKNSIWALIFPNLLFNAFYIILYKNSFAGNIHPALIEAAKLDGASELYIYFKIVMPLSLPILAAVGLMIGIGYWNDWINGQYYISDTNLYTLQVMLNKIIQNLQTIMQLGQSGMSTADLPSISIRMAIAVLGTLPILALYPVFNKAFVAGISLGGVKE